MVIAVQTLKLFQEKNQRVMSYSRFRLSKSWLLCACAVCTASLDRIVVHFLPRPVFASVVVPDVLLNGGDGLFFCFLVRVSLLDKDASSGALHLKNDDRKRLLADLLEV